MKSLIITPETDLGKMVALRDFIQNVNKCKEESDQIPSNAFFALTSGIAGSFATVGGSIYNYSPAIASGLATLGYSVEQIAEITKHFNNAKHAQKNAEKLFGEL